jgi:hypothetical protein
MISYNQGEEKTMYEPPRIILVVPKEGESFQDAMSRVKAEAIKEGISATLDERGHRYGDFRGHALITRNLKSTMQLSKNWGSLSADKKEALEMIAHKIGRILNGDPNYKDSWVDIEGYAHLISQTLKDQKRKKGERV